MFGSQVGAAVSFYEPGQKLKKARLTGSIVQVLPDGKSARVSVHNTKRHVTVRSDMLRLHGPLDKVIPMYVLLKFECRRVAQSAGSTMHSDELTDRVLPDHRMRKKNQTSRSRRFRVGGHRSRNNSASHIV